MMPVTIQQLLDGQGGNLAARVQGIGKTRTVTVGDVQKTVCDITLVDATGTISTTLWSDDEGRLSIPAVGDRADLNPAYRREYKGKFSAAVNRNGSTTFSACRDPMPGPSMLDQAIASASGIAREGKAETPLTKFMREAVRESEREAAPAPEPGISIEIVGVLQRIALALERIADRGGQYSQRDELADFQAMRDACDAVGIELTNPEPEVLVPEGTIPQMIEFLVDEMALARPTTPRATLYASAQSQLAIYLRTHPGTAARQAIGALIQQAKSDA